MLAIRRIDNRLISISIALVLLFSLLAAAFISPTSADGPGYALDFDGLNDYVSLGDTGDLMGGTGWMSTKTISVWLNPTTAAPPVSYPGTGEVIVSTDFPRLFGITRSVYNGLDRIWVWNADSNAVDMIGVAFTPGEWVNITMVHSGGMLTVYKNGVLVSSIPSGANPVTDPRSGDGRLFIAGSGRSGESYYFAGQIDEVRFFNSGLDAATIQELLNQEVLNTHPAWASLAAYYQMSDGAGTVLTDNSGHNRTGTLNGGMSDINWVPSGAFGGSLPSTPTFTNTPTPTSTFTPGPPPATFTDTPTPTNTTIPPSPTPTNTPTPTQTSGSGAGYNLQFDGFNDFVTLHPTSYIMANGWQNTKTVSLWVRPASLAPVCSFSTVGFCDNIFGDRSRWWGIAIGQLGTPGLNRIWVWNYDGSAGSIGDMIGIEYTPGEWVHIALVHSNGVLQAYKNGVLVGAVASGTTLQPNTGALPVLYLGGIINNAQRNWTFAGQIDEVQIWNVARTQPEILQSMYSTLSGAEFGLAAYYRMSNGSGTVLTDDSVFSWDGTLYDGNSAVPPNGSLPLWITPGPF